MSYVKSLKNILEKLIKIKIQSIIKIRTYTSLVFKYSIMNFFQKIY